jgi:pimeloyl-ACP methyl ester carboxylesterase
MLSAWLLWLASNLSGLMLALTGYTQGYVPTDYGRIHYFEAQGQGRLPPVVLLHGIGSQASDLFLIAEGLRPHVRKIITVDLPGHGQSEVAVEALPLEAFQTSVYQGLDQILAHEEPAILFGNSLGGWQAIRYAQYHPAELASLILVSPAGAQLQEPEYLRLQQIFGHDSTQKPEVLLPLLFNQPPPMADTVATFLQGRFSTPGIQGLLKRLDRESCLKPEQLQKLKLPVLLIWGKQDRVFPEELAFFKQALPPHARIIEPEHFTHSPYIEPGMDHELVQLMRDWSEDLAAEQAESGSISGL